MGGVGVVVGVVEEVVVDAVCSAILWQLSPPVGRFRVHPVGRSRVFLLGSGAGRSLRSLPPAPPARELTLAGSRCAGSTPSGGWRPLRSGRGRAEQAARLRGGSAPENCPGGIPRRRPSGNPPFRAPFCSPRHRCAVPAGAPLGGGAWCGRFAPGALAAAPCPERRVRGSPRMFPLGAASPPQAPRAWRQLASVACVGARASCGLRQSSSLSPHPARPPAPPAAGGSPGGLPLACRVLPCRAARVNRPRPARGSCALTRAPPSAGLVSGVLRPACGGLPSRAGVLSPGLRPVVARRPAGG